MMARIDLHETLSAFLAAMDVPAGSGLTIDEVELELPLEIGLSEKNGVLRVTAQPVGSIYHSGFEAMVQRTHLVAGMLDTDTVEQSGGRSGARSKSRTDSHESSHETGR